MATRLSIEKFKTDFCSQLMLRLHPLIRWITETEGEIILFINIIDRTPGQQETKTIYGGLLSQIPFLGRNPEESHQAWQELSEFRLDEGVVTQGLRQKYEDGILNLDEIKEKSLEDYFDTKDKEITEEQKIEVKIIRHYFDISASYYLSLPLIQFGNFDGVVHIIFSANDLGKFSTEFQKKLLIKLISNEYEGLLLSWDLVGENINKKSLLRSELKYVGSEEFEKSSNANPIFKSLLYRPFYSNSTEYFIKKVEQNDEIPEYLLKEHRKRAIISILIDSYAHNISAHSLTVLKWWFQQRASKPEELHPILEELSPVFDKLGGAIKEYLIQKFPEAYKAEEIEEGIKKELARWINIVDKRQKYGIYLPVRDQLLPLAEQLHPLFKFLLEKGAFWSGVTRDQQFGGEIRNLYEVLWQDFINNPLYLGTIAYSEGITRLNIHIRVYSERRYTGSQNRFRREYILETTTLDGKIIPLTGAIATINVSGAQDKNLEHDYVKEGEEYALLKPYLEGCEVFFPGGVVGKHAFFTLIENEIRNVKHYPETDLKVMREQGLDLFIGIRPVTISGKPSAKGDVNERHLYKIGVWLGHKTRLYDNKEHLTIKRLKGLNQDIVTEETNQAKLGGNYQDKICAAMLFNNTFVSVERQQSERDKNYYPWIRTAYSEGLQSDGFLEVDSEVRANILEEAASALEDRQVNPERGYFKKYFYLWRGKTLFHLEQPEDLEVENISRFKIVNIRKPDWRKAARESSVVRILEGLPAEITWEEAYQNWVRVWLKQPDGRIQLFRGGTEIGHLVYDQTAVKYFSDDEYWALPPEIQDLYGGYPVFPLKFAHSKDTEAREDRILSVRSHGILATRFFEGLQNINNFDHATIRAAHIYELLEIIETRICIFDKRVAERVDDNKRNFLAEQLHCEIYLEMEEQWIAVKQKGLSQYHFIIMHLSFIEAMKDASGKRYEEEGIDRFLEEQAGGQLGNNCIFVVTTGRGRELWWRKLQSSPFSVFVTFRPVEMLIEAVETGILKKDDIELKYNLAKVLFGS